MKCGVVPETLERILIESDPTCPSAVALEPGPHEGDIGVGQVVTGGRENAVLDGSAALAQLVGETVRIVGRRRSGRGRRRASAPAARRAGRRLVENRHRPQQNGPGQHVGVPEHHRGRDVGAVRKSERDRRARARSRLRACRTKIARSSARCRTSSRSNTPSPSRLKKRGMPRSSTWPRGDSSAAPGASALAEGNEIVLVAARAVQEQQRMAALASAGLETMVEGERRDDGHVLSSGRTASMRARCHSRNDGSFRLVPRRLGGSSTAKPGLIGRDLEDDPAGLPQIDRAEIVAILLFGRADADACPRACAPFRPARHHRPPGTPHDGPSRRPAGRAADPVRLEIDDTPQRASAAKRVTRALAGRRAQNP